MNHKEDLPETRDKINPLTTLKQTEYDLLLSAFDPLVTEKLRNYTLKGEPRKWQSYQEHHSSSLRGSAAKLDFILMYMKENPNQSYHGHLFGLSQGKVSQWVHFLTPVLHKALEEMSFMPSCGVNVECPQEENLYLAVDATERPVARRTDYERQKAEYSGKKKQHTIKNIALSDDKGYIYFMSSSYEGSIHDKAIWDELSLEERAENLLADLGFLGADKDCPNIVMPFKKPKGAELTEQQKLINTAISSARVIIEHAFAGVKRLKIIRDKIRVKGSRIRDEMMFIATALHNFRLYNRKLRLINKFS